MKTIELSEEQIAYLTDLKSNKKKRKFLLDSIIRNLTIGKLFPKPIGERIVFENGEIKTEEYNDGSKLVGLQKLAEMDELKNEKCNVCRTFTKTEGSNKCEYCRDFIKYILETSPEFERYRPKHYEFANKKPDIISGTEEAHVKEKKEKSTSKYIEEVYELFYKFRQKANFYKDAIDIKKEKNEFIIIVNEGELPLA